MQSLLYLTEAAGCYKRAGKLGPALKKYLAIHKVSSKQRLFVIHLLMDIRGMTHIGTRRLQERPIRLPLLLHPPRDHPDVHAVSTHRSSLHFPPPEDGVGC